MYRKKYVLLLNNEYAASGNRMAEVPLASVSRSQNAPKSLAAAASPQTPLGELTALPQTRSWITGVLLLRGGEGG